MSVQGVHVTTPSGSACIVEEPSDADGVSERSASVGEQTRYTMAEMEAYIRLVQDDREQLQKEVQHLKEGVKALFNAMQQPVADVQHLRSEHEQTRELVENIDKFKGEVTKSLSQLTVKCNTLDQHVPELREKLEQAINTINTAQENMMAANAQSSPAPSEHSAQDLRIDTVEAIMNLREKARQMETERVKKSRDMEALMMELSAIRGRMKEGIAANARHDALQPRLLNNADEVLEAVAVHTRGHVELGSEHVTVHVGVLAELISFQAAKGAAAVRPAARAAAPRSRATTSAARAGPAAAAVAAAAPRMRAPKSHKVDVSQEVEVSPIAPHAGTRHRRSDSGMKSSSMPMLGPPPKPRSKLVPRYEAVPRDPSARTPTEAARSVVSRSVTPTGTSRSTASRAFARPASGPSAMTAARTGAAGTAGAGPSGRDSSSDGAATRGTGSRAARPTSSLARLSKPKGVAEAAQRKPRSTAAATSGIPRRAPEAGRASRATASRGASVASSTTARSPSVASTARLTHTASEEFDEGALAALNGADSESYAAGSSMMSIGEDSECSTKLLARPAPSAEAERPPSRLQPPRRAGAPPLTVGGAPEAVGDRNSPSMSLSSTASVPNMSVYSPANPRGTRVIDGLQTNESPGSPEFSSHSPLSSSVQVRSFRKAVLSASQDRGIIAAAVAEGEEQPIADVDEAEHLGEQSADSLRLNLDQVHKASPQRNGSSRSHGGENSVRSWLNGEGRMGIAGSEPEPLLSGGLPNSLPTTNTTPRMEHQLPSSFDNGSTPPADPGVTPRTPKSKRRRSDGTSSPDRLHGGSPPHRHSLGGPLSPAKHGSPRTAATGSPQGSPGRRQSLNGQMDRNQSLSTLAPVMEEPSVLPASIAETLSGASAAASAAASPKPSAVAAVASVPAKVAGGASGIRISSSLDWLQSQTSGSQKENQTRNRVVPSTAAAGSSMPSKLRSFVSSATKGSADLEAQQRQMRRASQLFQPDNFSIDSKDSCKPEKCDSPLKAGDRSARNGQGTDPPLRPNAQLEQRIAQLRSEKEGV